MHNKGIIDYTGTIEKHDNCFSHMLVSWRLSSELSTSTLNETAVNAQYVFPAPYVDKRIEDKQYEEKRWETKTATLFLKWYIKMTINIHLYMFIYKYIIYATM